MTNSPRAVYAGTFDPLTNGHADIILRACRVFGGVHVAVAGSTPKQTQFSVDDRVEMVKQSVAELAKADQKVSDLANLVQVSPFEGLLVNYVKTLGAAVIVRGLRAVSDYEYEAQMAHINRNLADSIETVFLVTSEHCSFISSSIVREIAKNGGDVKKLVPENVAKRLESL